MNQSRRKTLHALALDVEASRTAIDAVLDRARFAWNPDEHDATNSSADMIRDFLAALDDADNEKGQIEGLSQAVGDVRDEEQESFDNLPEGFQQGERGQAMEQAAGMLDDAVSALEQAGDDLGDLLQISERLDKVHLAALDAGGWANLAEGVLEQVLEDREEALSILEGVLREIESAQGYLDDATA